MTGQGAAPARQACVSLAPGRLRGPPYGHYDPCAGSLLDGQIALSDPARKRGPRLDHPVLAGCEDAASGAPEGERAPIAARPRRLMAWNICKVRRPALRSPLDMRGHHPRKAGRISATALE